MTKILLVDDEPLLLESLEIILSLSGDYVVTGKAGNGVEALQLLSKEVPDLMLVDLNMPGMGGIELIPKVHAEYPDIRIIVLTTFYDENSISHAIAGGACGYILKDSGKDAILNAISQAMNGQSVLDLKVMQKLNNMLANGTAEKAPEKTQKERPAGAFSEEKTVDLSDYGMTDREKEICRLISEGCTNSQIASILFISEGTVKNYVSTIYDKLGEHDRTKAVLMLQRCKF
ncbi:MAG: response regulator transcription factor [Clostridiales bacterium]|nr:response regulator transcription factor [Clostridiales bacterium]